MVRPLYRIDIRPDIALLDVAWLDLFTPAAVADYAAQVKARFREDGMRPGYLLRIDMTRSAVQPQEALAAFRHHLGDFPKARRIAVVTGSAIARLQVRREMTQPYLCLFEDAAMALDWLLEAEPVAA